MRLLAGAHMPLPGDAGGAQRGKAKSPARGCAPNAARWSSGQDGGLSRRKREFDSPTGHHFFFQMGAVRVRMPAAAPQYAPLAQLVGQTGYT